MARGTSYFSDEQGREWDDETLWAAAAKEYVLPSVLIGGLIDIATIEALVDDYLRIKSILEAPDDQPAIILSPDGRIADGFHRCAARLIAGKNFVHAVQLDAMPPPDRLNGKTLPCDRPINYESAKPLPCAFTGCSNDSTPGGLLCAEHRPVLHPEDRNCPTCIKYIKPRWDCPDCGGTGTKP